MYNIVYMIVYYIVLDI